MRTKGTVEVVNRFHIFRAGDRVADCNQSRSLPYAEMQANAAHLAAGWNLLETLEGMHIERELMTVLTCASEDAAEDGRGFSAELLRDLSAAIRTALESKP